ncbi:thiamine-phosphate pyrophosphorylase [Friedmanniella luteola]|uniref:Thiamine-phosphate pyrophosphorylase n=2 Tax=Friedmanniella luteola TaxID=546871 RepID=A0A1H1P984_9ACTN|nr:thiamine-phosphate pyrophosphorylase [Friedmanniella luteola]
MGLEARLRLARLFLRTDARRRQGDLAAFLTAAFAGGVDVVQIRQDGLDVVTGREVLETARRAAASAQAVVGVLGDPAWAGALQADLLHVGAAGGSSAEARAPLHASALLGRSTRRATDVGAALADDALDYFSVGPVHAAPGLELVRHAARVAPVFDVAAKPWFAVGGVTEASLVRVLDAGARRVCVETALTAADDPQEAAARLARPLAEAWRADPAAARYGFAAAASRGRPR